MRRVAHPYMRWEDYQAGMYGKAEGSAAALIEEAYELLTDDEAFGSAISVMLLAWPTAAENWLSRPGAKSRSWLGAAACMHATKAPQHCTRSAWWLMTADQQDAANAVADQARAAWIAEREERASA